MSLRARVLPCLVVSACIPPIGQRQPQPPPQQPDPAQQQQEEQQRMAGLLDAAGIGPNLTADNPKCDMPTRFAGATTVHVMNVASQPICEVKIVSRAESRCPTTPNWLPRAHKLDRGATIDLGVAPGWYSVRLNKCSGTGDDSLLAMQQMVDLERPTSVVLRDGPAAKFEWPRDQALVALNVGEYSEGLHNGNDACVHYPVETRTNVGGPAYQAADRKNCTSGIQKRDSSFCDCISDDSDLQTFCTAVATENLDGCEGINASGLRERCRRVTVHRAHDTSGCRAEG